MWKGGGELLMCGMFLVGDEMKRGLGGKCSREGKGV